MAYKTELSPRIRAYIRLIDILVIRLANHWLFYASLFWVAFAGLPVLAPVLMHYGLEAPARVIYTVYSFTCHQLAYRSWFFFGAQPSYTVDQLQQYLNVANPPLDLFFWRGFVGNAQLGYKMAYCERDLAIHLSVLFAGLVYGLLHGRIRPLSWRWYLVLGVLPMGIDGGTQLIMLRESTPLLRAVTGILFGGLTVWTFYPTVDEAMRDLRSQTAKQLERLSRRELNPKESL